MKLNELKEKYDLNHLTDERFDIAKHVIERLDKMSEKGVDHASVEDVDHLISALLKEQTLGLEMFYGLMRYFYMIGRTDLYIRLTQYTGGIGVFERILNRLEKVKGDVARKRITEKFTLPLLGTTPEKLPLYTEKLMILLKDELPTESLFERVLSGNNHGIPDEAFYEEKAAYEASESLTAYLNSYHQRQIETLRAHAESGKPWFEQKMTHDVVDFVASNPEIQGGVYKDGYIYETKIPYDIIKFLEAKTHTDKRYYACHCPFARERITDDLKDIDALWCHCSGGFVKRRYEVIFGRPLKAKPLENALKGDEYCRFMIDVRDIPNLK